MAPGVRRARQCHGVQPGRQAPGDRDVDGTTLWDTATWRRVGPPLRSSQGGWEGVDFSPDGRTLAIAGGEGRVELWDVATRKERGELTDPAAARDPASPRSPSFGSAPTAASSPPAGRRTNHVTLWDAASGRVIGRPITTNPPGRAARNRSPSARTRSGSPSRALPGRSGSGRSPRGAGSESRSRSGARRGGGDLRRRRPDADRERRLRLGVHGRRRNGTADRPPLSVGRSPPRRWTSARTDGCWPRRRSRGSVFVWDTKTGAPYGSPLTADTSPVNDVAFSPDGRTLVSSHLRSAVVWNMNGEQAIGEPLGGPADLTTDVAFSPDGKRLVAGRFDGGTVVYDTATRRQAVSGSTAARSSPRSPSTPTGTSIAVGTIDGQVRFFDPTSGAAVGSPLDERKLGGLAGRLQPGRSAARGGGRPERRGRVLRPAAAGRGAALGRGLAPSRGAGDRAGRRIGALRGVQPGRHAAGDRQLRGRLDLWDVATQARHGKPMRVADDGFPSVAFDPSGRLVAGRRSDRPGAGVAGGRSAAGLSAPRRAHRPGHRGGVRPGRLVPRDHELFGGTRLWDPATGLGYGDELVASPRPGSLKPTIDLPVPGAAERVQPGRQAAGRRGSRHPRDAVGRRPGGLAPARVRDRRAET